MCGKKAPVNQRLALIASRNSKFKLDQRDGTVMSGTTLVRSSTLTSSTVSVYQGVNAINTNGVLVSDGVLFMSSNTKSMVRRWVKVF